MEQTSRGSKEPNERVRTKLRSVFVPPVPETPGPQCVGPLRAFHPCPTCFLGPARQHSRPLYLTALGIPPSRRHRIPYKNGVPSGTGSFEDRAIAILPISTYDPRGSLITSATNTSTPRLGGGPSLTVWALVSPAPSIGEISSAGEHQRPRDDARACAASHEKRKEKRIDGAPHPA